MANVAIGAAAMGALAAFGKTFTRLRREQLWWYLALVSVVAVLGQEVARTAALIPVSANNAADFDGFGDDLDEAEFENDSPVIVPPHVVRHPGFENDRGPPVEDVKEQEETPVQEPVVEQTIRKKQQEQWDEDEFEGLPEEDTSEPTTADEASVKTTNRRSAPTGPQNYYMEAFSVIFLVAYAVNYFLGKKENERIALAWATEYASKDRIFEKNFSLLGVGEGEDEALLMKEGQNVFKFYASGRRYCQGLLATLDLKNRHDLLSRLWYFIMPCKDELTIDVYMNEENMDNVILAVSRRKNAKAMNKDWRDLQQFASPMNPPSQRRWVSEELSVLAESKEVASDLLFEAVLDAVFGEKAFKEHGSNFVSLHFSDAYPMATHKKLLQFKFNLPPSGRMNEITKLIQIVPYFIDAVGRYKLSPQAKAKTDATRQKLMQEAYKQAHNARQEAIARKREEKDAKLTPEILRKKEEKERAKQMKKAMPKVKMQRAH